MVNITVSGGFQEKSILNSGCIGLIHLPSVCSVQSSKKEKVEKFFNFLKENANTILLIIGAIVAVDIAIKLAGVVLAAKALVGLVMNPAFLTIVAVIAAFYGLAKLGEKLGKPAFNADMQNLNLKENQLYEDYVERFKKDFGRDPNPKEKLQLYTDAKVKAQKYFAMEKNQTNIEKKQKYIAIFRSDFTTFLFYISQAHLNSIYLKNISHGEVNNLICYVKNHI